MHIAGIPPEHSECAGWRRILLLVRDGRSWYAAGVAEGGSHDAAPGHDVPFGERLRRLREAAGLTQEELADRAGLSVRAIRSLERGERKNPYPHTVRSLADALELPDDERASLLAAVPGRGGAVRAAPAAAFSKSDLPIPSTPLLGREKELREIMEYFGGVRLLTLTGTGGVGKTHLALESARASLAAGLFPDGVAFVALAPLEDPALVIPTVARALGLREAEGQTAGDTLRAHLREKRLLLVLDNFEHVLEAAPKIAELMESCPDVTMLATSRSPLRVRGEQEYSVGPLALPASTQSPEAEEVLGSPSGRLFVERARSTSPTFEVTGENAGAVAAICWRLAGLPLALELAAARARFLGPAALLARLDRVLSAGWARDLPERQRTMRAALDWSHDLLSEGEKVLFRRLSVFAGGFSLEAAESIGAEPGAAGEVEDVLGLLGELAEQSLVAVQTDGEVGARYGMLEPVRQYARELLEESGEAEDARRRHAAFFLDLVERAYRELRGPRQVGWLDTLDLENGNLRAAVSWSLERGDAEGAIGFGWVLWQYWWARGHADEGRRWMEAALAKGDDLLPTLAKARGLYVVGAMLLRSGETERPVELFEESLTLFEHEGDEAGAVWALLLAGVGTLRGGNPARAAGLLEECARIARALGDPWSEAQALMFLGTVSLAGGDHGRAQDLLGRALTLARQIGDPGGMFGPTYHLALAAHALDDYHRAARLYAGALKLAEELKDTANVGYCLWGLAECSVARDEPERAARLYGTAEASLESVGMRFHAFATGHDFHERYLSLARAQLDEQAWAAAWSEGRGMGFEQAVAYALGGDAAAPAVP